MTKNLISIISSLILKKKKAPFSMDILQSLSDVKFKRKLVLGINGLSIKKISEIENFNILIGNMDFSIKKIAVREFNYNRKIKFDTDIISKHKFYFKNSKKEVYIIE
ncbi:MAG: hypothetical protein SOU08_02850 [Anaerococcus sp.]|nr:hypothetical protein [Anaerococcus sp.]